MILTEIGKEMVCILLQYLEILLASNIEQCYPELFEVVDQRNRNAPFGSKQNWMWRFTLTASHSKLKTLLPTQNEINKVKTSNKSMIQSNGTCFIPLLTFDQQLVAISMNIVYSCSELMLIQHFVKDNSIRRFISPIIVKSCPLLMASLDIDYVERRGLVAWKHTVNNLEFTLRQLTEIFQTTLNDSRLQVIGANYTSICLYLSDNTVLTVENVDDISSIDRYALESDNPFWIFDNIVVLCIGFIHDNQAKAIIAASALTTLLHKRKHVLLDEAKGIAREKIQSCTSFQSKDISSKAGAKTDIFSYTDILFPIDHESFFQNPISLGKHFITEQNTEHLSDETERNQPSKTVQLNMNYVADDQLYQARAKEIVTKLEQKQQQSEYCLETLSSGLLDKTDQEQSLMPTIFDSTVQEHTGRCAEHFFYRYLEQLYGADITPTGNWRSSTRLLVFPNFRHNVDDSAGYDFIIKDTRQMFLRGAGDHVITCFIEVKGIKDKYNEKTTFHISNNELQTRNNIATNDKRKEKEAYLIVIIENSLNPSAIGIGTVIIWYVLKGSF
ncbi:unnamed protein product [Didymodactylos carnosus]|uniref:Protein NO VEIN C-terminal domain-containing protein n=1 Tax=Didymodactylos carnosus TaxID=1234261 RepID=A0A8S2FFV8_9BILA|nr:unnamed protein product [Didymodactylos carnosus]CAF4250427.1 unnamed protein product [Didymodactylos carnosus]